MAIIVLAAGVLLVCAVHILSAIFLDSQIQYIETSFLVKSPALDGYTIAFLTDTHNISGSELTVIAEKVNDRKPDLTLLGGDYPAKDAAWRTMKILSEIKTPDGIYGVDGNHDLRKNVYPAMEEYGIVPLDNTGVKLREGLFVAGVQDLQKGQPDVKKAVEEAAPQDTVVLLSHNPDVSMEQDMSQVDLVLSGHTHGGQITFFGMFAPAMHVASSYGQKFQSGWVSLENGTQVLVSNGIGTHHGIPRVFARPQVIFITLKKET